MSATNVLITGAGGQVGVDLVDLLSARRVPGSDESFQPDGVIIRDDEFVVTALSRIDLDVTNEFAVERAVSLSRPDVIVNLAAYTQVDAAEDDAVTCDELNHLAPVSMSRVAEIYGAHFITISTDYVFDGTKGEAYIEADLTNPLNVYGRTKLDGELGCATSDCVIRTSWVLGVRGRNVVHFIRDRVRSGESVAFVTDQLGSPTLSADLARALVAVIRERPTGVLHVANRGVTSWFDLAREVAFALGANNELVTPTTMSERRPTPRAHRPARSDLSIQHWCDMGFGALPEWRDGIRRFLSDC